MAVIVAYEGPRDKEGENDMTKDQTPRYKSPLVTLIVWMFFSCVQWGQSLETAEWQLIQLGVFGQQVSLCSSLPQFHMQPCCWCPYLKGLVMYGEMATCTCIYLACTSVRREEIPNVITNESVWIFFIVIQCADMVL